MHDTTAGPTDTLTAYEQFYGLCARPFSLTPDLRFVFNSQSHVQVVREVSEALRHREGLVVVVGEPGTGKTMLCREMIESFREARTFLSVILDPLLSVDDLLYHVLEDFGIIAAGSRTRHDTLDRATRHQLVSTLQQFLGSLVPLHAHAVIMIDEAQHLTRDVLEQLRLLSDVEADGAKLLQIVIVGPPELDARLAEPDMRSFRQRIARRITPEPLRGDEVRAYIEHRLAVAACTDLGRDETQRIVEFQPSAFRAVERVSGGIPRVVNTVCDRALEIGAAEGVRAIDARLVLAAARRLQLPSSGRRRWWVTSQQAAVAAVIGAIAAGGTSWWLSRSRSMGSVAAQPAPAAQLPSKPVAARAPEATAAGARPIDRRPEPAAATSARGVSAAPVAPLAAPAPLGESYEIVVAAFRTSKRAVDVAAEVKAKGLPAMARDDPSGNWHQVIVGPYPSKEAAQSAQLTLAAGGIRDTRIVMRGGAPPR